MNLDSRKTGTFLLVGCGRFGCLGAGFVLNQILVYDPTGLDRLF